MKVNLPLQSYETKSLRQNNSTLMNMYAVQDTAGGTNEVSLYPTPGLSLFCNTSGLSVRGAITVHGIAYIVKDDKFGSLTDDGVYTDIGTLNTSTGRVSMAAIFDQITIATGGTGYLYIISTNTFSAIASNYPANCEFVTSQDEYFIAIKPDSDTFYLSNISDGATYDALNFAAVQAKSGNLLAAVSIFQQIWFLKDSEMEVWYNSGGDFPFSRQDGSSVNYGISAPLSLVSANNTTFWYGQALNGTGYVVTTSGSQPQIVSTEACHYQWSTYSRTDDAHAYSYQQEGHEFYVITFPTASKTWVYDINTDKWHERNSINTVALTAPDYTRHRGNCYTFLNGHHLIGDFISGKIFELDNNEFVDDTSNTIQRQFITAPLQNEGRRLFVHSVELIAEVGQGLTSGQGSDPLIIMEVSRDGGHTWGNKRSRRLGEIGQYMTRVRWNLIGAARNMVFRFTMTDPIKFIAINLEIEISGEIDITRKQ